MLRELSGKENSGEKDGVQTVRTRCGDPGFVFGGVGWGPVKNIDGTEALTPTSGGQLLKTEEEKLETADVNKGK